jgi:hypothetical protein
MSQTKAQLLDGKASSIQFSTGSASSPTISFTGDTNTGIYSPGADQVAISTNGTGRLFVDASGNVGIGTNGPISPLHISNSTNPKVYLEKPGQDALELGIESGVAPYIACGTNLTFRSGGSTERMRLDSSGRLGLGTSSPAEKLEVANGSIAGSVITGRTYTLSNVSSSNPTTVNGSGFTSIPVQVGDIIAFPFSQTRTVTSVVSDTQLTVDSAWTVSFAGSNVTGTGGLGFRTNSTSRVAITAGGNVGIGTTSPGQALHVVGIGRFQGSASSGTGIYVTGTSDRAVIDTLTYGAAAPLAFDINGSEKARIDSSGRLLVGTSSASGSNTLFESSSTAANSANVALVKRNSGTADQAGQQLHFYNFGPSGTARAADTEVGNIRFYGSQPTSGAAQEMASIQCAADLIQTGTNTSGRLVFSTTADGASSPTERMRISNNGTVSINATSSGQQLNVTHSGRDGIAVADTNGSSINANILFSNARAAGTSNYYLLGYANAVNTFIVYSNGNIQNSNNSYGAISDIKLKENIVDANSQWNDLKALQVRNYNFKEGQTHTQIGLIAQEVELVSPGLVTESLDRDEEGNDLGTVTKSVNYSVLYMKAVKALQEAMERIEVLEQRLTDAGIA